MLAEGTFCSDSLTGVTGNEGTGGRRGGELGGAFSLFVTCDV